MTLLAARAADEVDESELVVGRRIQRFSELAGPLAAAPDRDGSFRVAYRGVNAVHGRGRAWRTLAISTFAFAFEVLAVVWILQPGHLPPVEDGSAFARYANAFVVFSIIVMEALRIVNVLFIALASVIACDPVPVPPQPDRRVAFLTTIVPSKEPIEVVRGTLQAAMQIQYDGILDVWILDEGDSPDVRAVCRELGVNHFTRKHDPQYNQPKGAFKAKSKHGNYNAWVAEHGDYYDVFLSVDPDHVPLPNYAERILGYFRDPDVAFISGPQCYANDETFVTRGAESQQFMFHSLIQRAANRFGVGMLVGTNNAVRISALKAVGGLSDSITEDMATGLKIHTRRNPATGRRWKSVYTPDVLAVGEGPSSWGDFFSQQMRWARGTLEVLLGQFWRRLPRLSPGRALHYCLLTTFYPAMALGWLFGAVNACLFLALGVQGIVVPVQLWLALYVDAAVIQLWLYVRNRRYNVSPYEVEGSSGLKGMMMSTVAAPIYSAALVATLLRRPARFVVTPKGVSSSEDHILTFRRHLQWGLLIVAAIVVAGFTGHTHPAVLMWPVVMLLTCVVPPVSWVIERVVGRHPVVQAGAVSSETPSGLTTETLQRAAIDALRAAGSTARRSEAPSVEAGEPVSRGLPTAASTERVERLPAPFPAPRQPRPVPTPRPRVRPSPATGRRYAPDPSPFPVPRGRPAGPPAATPRPTPAPRPAPPAPGVPHRPLRPEPTMSPSPSLRPAAGPSPTPGPGAPLPPQPAAPGPPATERRPVASVSGRSQNGNERGLAPDGHRDGHVAAAMHAPTVAVRVVALAAVASAPARNRPAEPAVAGAVRTEAS